MKTKRTLPLRAWVTPDEKQEVEALAKKAHLTVSELVRRLVTGRKLPDTNRHLAVLDLVKVNADQARLGNLLRMVLDDPDLNLPDGMDLEMLFDKIRETQTILKLKIKEL